MRRCLLVVMTLAGLGGPSAADGLKPFVKGSWPQILAAHKGRPTIVHFWGMACAPCRVEMPRWGAFIAAHPGVDMVTIDTDPPTADRRDPEMVLRTSHLQTSDAWRFGDPFVEKLYFSVDPTWQGEIPLTLLIARNGTIAHQLGAMSTHDMDRWLGAQK